MTASDFHFARRGWFLGLLFAVLAFARWRSPQPVEALGLIPIAAGACYRLYAGRFIADHSNGVRLSGKVLALDGPYRFGRHPLYLSNLILIAGLILFANCLLWIGAAVLFAAACLHHALLARMEERHLAGLWGEAYLGYMRVTPRWLGMPGTPAGGPAAASAGASATGAGPGSSWARQGANLGKSAICVIILWLLAAIHR